MQHEDVSKQGSRISESDKRHGMDMDRRDFLRAMGLGTLAVVGGGALAGHSTQGIAAQAKKIVWANWPLSIDTAPNGDIPSLQQFNKRTGIKAVYKAVINDNNSYYAKIKPLMENHQSIGADVISPTGWMANVMMREGWIQKLDKSQLPNAVKNLIGSEVFAHPPFDPKREYTMPWQGWLAGIAVNTEVTGRPVHSIKDMLTADDLKGRVAVLNELPETMGLMLLYTGAKPEHFSDSQFETAIDALKKARADRQIIRVTGNNYAPALARGNLAACFAWAGDVVQLHKNNPKIKFFIPDEGAVMTQDQMMIPKYIDAEHTQMAHKLIDYYFRPEVAAQVASYINAVCPVAGAKEAMEKLDPELASNQLIFPDAKTLERIHGFEAMTPAELKKYQGKFEQAIGL